MLQARLTARSPLKTFIEKLGPTGSNVTEGGMQPFAANTKQTEASRKAEIHLAVLSGLSLWQRMLALNSLGPDSLRKLAAFAIVFSTPKWA